MHHQHRHRGVGVVQPSGWDRPEEGQLAPEHEADHRPEQKSHCRPLRSRRKAHAHVEPAPLLHRPPTWGPARAAAAVALAIAASLLLAHHSVLGSGLRRVPGDPGDVRFAHRDSFARVEGGEIFLYNVHISPYSHRGYADHEPLRRRKLLLHRQEIDKLLGKTREKGLTLVPTKLYLKNGRIKLEIAVGKGKKFHDKRESAREREMDAEARAGMRRRAKE